MSRYPVNMDHEQIYIRPSEVFSYSSDAEFKSPTIQHNDHVWCQGEKFTKYDSSPESMASYNDDNSFSPVEGPVSVRSRELLNAIKQQMLPYHSLPETFTSFPFPLDTRQESLVSTYLGCAERLYGFSHELRPQPTATIISIAMSTPALFHIVLAISAQYRLMNDQQQSFQNRKELECMVMAHKGEAMQLVQNLSRQAVQGKQSDDLMISIVGFGILDRYCNDDETASVHFAAGRQLLRSIGGPLCIQNLLMSRSMAHFECGYGSSTESMVWDRGDFGSLHTDLNRFFTNVWTFQGPPSSKHQTSRRNSTTSVNSQSPFEQSSSVGLRFDTILYECLSRKPEDTANPTQHDRRDMIFQLTCLLILSTLTVDYWTDPQGFQSYMDSVHDLVAASLTRDQPMNNVMWLLQIHDDSDMHTKRVWSTAGWVWVLRHVNYNVQTMVKGWLIAILTGRPVSRALKLDSFAFSYAS